MTTLPPPPPGERGDTGGERSSARGRLGVTVARAGFEPRVAGKRAECDGGGPIPGTRYAGREEYAGTLTGDYVDHGDPAWRWYLLGQLTRTPPGYEAATVWCEAGSVFLVDERDAAPPGPARAG